MRPQRVAINLRWAGRMLAWSALMASTLALALVLQALAASALVAPGPVALSAGSVIVAPADALSAACQAALTAGDNQRESFLEHSCGGAAGATFYYFPGRPY